jgi:hypothetical protein
VCTPVKNVPLALGLDVAGCTGLYLLMTVSYLKFLSLNVLATSSHAGADLAARVMGHFPDGLLNSIHATGRRASPFYCKVCGLEC